MKCPIDTTVDLVMTDRQGIEIDYCPTCRGVWLDRGELDKLIERSAAVLPQPAPQPVVQPAPAAAPLPASDYRPDQRPDPRSEPRPDDRRPRWDDDDDDDDRSKYRDGYGYKKKKRSSILGEIFDF
jgi:Zn-finger nucleic acid-binding protein